jgi:hypothetical protein
MMISCFFFLIYWCQYRQLLTHKHFDSSEFHLFFSHLFTNRYTFNRIDNQMRFIEPDQIRYKDFGGQDLVDADSFVGIYLKNI